MAHMSMKTVVAGKQTTAHDRHPAWPNIYHTTTFPRFWKIKSCRLCITNNISQGIPHRSQGFRALWEATLGA